MNDQINKLLAYIISSAVGCLKEPKIYGSLRLIDTAEKIIILANDLGLTQEENLTELADVINEGKWLCMTDEVAFEQMLNRASIMMLELMDE